MPWSQTTPMDQKTQFIADYLRKRLSITELCELYGISRKTGYKVIDRYLRLGPQGLEELSRRPASCPNRTPDYIEQAIVAARQRHPSWGAKKLLSILYKSHRRWSFPTRSTVCDILSRNGLVPKQRRRRHIGHPGKPISQILAPNDVWCADFKGQFKTGDGRYCYPLTVTDGFSRFLLGCQALSSTRVAEAKPVFVRLFKEFGLPRRIRTDNEVPFATNTLARLSQLSAWWVRLGYCPSSSNPANHNKTDAMNACTAPSKPKPPDRRLTPAVVSSADLIGSATSLISNALTRLSTSKRRLRSMNPLHVKCRRNFHRSNILTASNYDTSAPMAVYDGINNG
jgi:putative transposase